MATTCPVTLYSGGQALTADGLVRLALLPTLLSITFTAQDNSSITVNFQRSRKLFSSFALNQPSTSRDKQICHFEGTDHGRGSWLSACNAEGTIGIVRTPSNVFTLRTRAEGFELGFGGNKNCGFGSHNAPTADPDYYSDYADAFKQRRYVELALFADKSTCDTYGSESAANDRLHSLANLLQAFFKQVNMELRIMFTEVWCAGDKAKVVKGDGDATVKAFAEYIEKVATDRRHDTGILLTNEKMNNNLALGIACKSEISGAMVIDYSYQDIPWVMAHELSHLFAVPHDDHFDHCECPAEIGCVHSGAGFYFSDCSLRALKDYVTSDQANCLLNKPNEPANKRHSRRHHLNPDY